MISIVAFLVCLDSGCLDSDDLSCETGLGLALYLGLGFMRTTDLIEVDQ